LKHAKKLAGIKISERMEKYIVDIIAATRYPDKYSKELDQWIDFRCQSARGSIAIDRASRTHAWMNVVTNL
jgi:MoxR-like ATPase